MVFDCSAPVLLVRAVRVEDSVGSSQRSTLSRQSVKGGRMVSLPRPASRRTVLSNACIVMSAPSARRSVPSPTTEFTVPVPERTISRPASRLIHFIGRDGFASSSEDE